MFGILAPIFQFTGFYMCVHPNSWLALSKLYISNPFFKRLVLILLHLPNFLSPPKKNPGSQGGPQDCWVAIRVKNSFA